MAAATPATSRPRLKARRRAFRAAMHVASWTAWGIFPSAKPRKPSPTPSWRSAPKPAPEARPHARRGAPFRPARAAGWAACPGMADNPSVSRRRARRIFVGARRPTAFGVSYVSRHSGD
ncbi:hypothetical protein G6F57_020874 [Rhizopus arrhizus]|nr:hypothetical protein G6F57_020874 [Rhizopus arrhizus]